MLLPRRLTTGVGYWGGVGVCEGGVSGVLHRVSRWLARCSTPLTPPAYLKGCGYAAFFV